MVNHPPCPLFQWERCSRANDYVVNGEIWRFGGSLAPKAGLQTVSAHFLLKFMNLEHFEILSFLRSPSFQEAGEGYFHQSSIFPA